MNMLGMAFLTIGGFGVFLIAACEFENSLLQFVIMGIAGFFVYIGLRIVDPDGDGDISRRRTRRRRRKRIWK